MTRLITSGVEIGLNAEASPHGAQTLDGTATRDTTVARSGAASLKLASSLTTGLHGLLWNFAGTASTLRHYYARAWVMFDANPTSVVHAVKALVGTGDQDIGIIRINTDGSVGLFRDGATQYGSNTSPLSLNTWHRLELRFFIGATAGANEIEGRLNGVTFASQVGTNGQAIVPQRLRIGQTTSSGGTGGANIWFDDIAMNDTVGATSEVSWPSDGKIVLLKPASDNARDANWTEGDGGTTQLFADCNNTPPIGVATPVTGSQIQNVASDSTGNYDADLTTYQAAGVEGMDTIVLVQPVIVTGSNNATNTAGAFQILSNPVAGADTTLTTFDNGVAGAYPTNWLHTAGSIIAAPAVDTATAPVMRVGKRTATTRHAYVAFMGVQVEYVPGVPSLIMAPRIP